MISKTSFRNPKASSSEIYGGKCEFRNNEFEMKTTGVIFPTLRNFVC